MHADPMQVGPKMGGGGVGGGGEGKDELSVCTCGGMAEGQCPVLNFSVRVHTSF